MPNYLTPSPRTRLTPPQRIGVAALKSLMLAALIGMGGSVAQSADGQPQHPFPGEAKADIWVLGGQSNMQGAGRLKAQVTPDRQIQVFGMNNEWSVAQLPLHRLFEAKAPVHKELLVTMNGCTAEHYEKAARESVELERHYGGVCPGFFFARRLADNLDQPIGLIPCAHGATSMSHWDPALKDKGNHSLYGAMLERIEMVGDDIKGVLWYQGESDHSPIETAQDYERKMLAFIDALRADTGIADLPIIIVQLSRYATHNPALPEGWELVRDVQRTLPTKRDNVYTVSAIDLAMDELIHIGYEGHKRLGARMAEIALNEIYKVPGHATPIDLAAIEPIDPKAIYPRVRVRFSGVNGRLSAPGRATGFSVVSPTGDTTCPEAFKVDFDPDDPASVIVWLSAPITDDAMLIYGKGLDPYVNIVDEKDIPIPGFGPIKILAE